MIFVGGGALLAQAVSCARKLGLCVDAVCCPVNDRSIPRLKMLGVAVFETDNPDIELLEILNNFAGKTVFSVNNRHIFGDELLSSGADFFNIHNGLIQKYRGAPQVCVFAALCKCEKRYGVTLHKILPGRRVDSGPVVAQLEFNIGSDDVFSTVFTRSLDACQEIFELNVERVVAGSYIENEVELCDSEYLYQHLAQIRARADAYGFEKARNLGPYGRFFPKFKSMIESMR